MISFLIPTHNYGRFLARCIKSILSNNPNYIKEILVVNDSSTDNTDKVMKNFNLNKNKIFYYKKNYRNLSKVMNFAIKKTKGELLCKIDPDDQIKKSFAEILATKFNELQCDFLYSNFIVKDFKSKFRRIKFQKINPFLKKFQYPHGSGCLFKKQIWRELNGFNEKNYYQDDYDFWLRINKKKKYKISYYNTSQYIYNKHNQNMSNSVFKKNLTKLKVFISNL